MTFSIGTLSLTGRTWSPVGIDFGQRLIKAVQCKRVRGGWRLARAIAIPRAERTAIPSAAECARLAGVLYRRGFEGSDVVVAAPHGALLSSVMDLPPRSSGAPVDTIARMELARSHKRDASALEVAWWDLPEPARPGGSRASDGMAAMAVGMTHEHSAAILDGMSAAGLQVLAIEPLPMSLARAALPLCGGGGLSAIIDVGWTATTLSLIHGSTLIYTRGVEEAGLRKLYERAMPRMAVDEQRLDRLLAGTDEESTERRGIERELQAQLEQHSSILSRELMASLTYAGHRYPGVARGTLLLCGGGAELAGLAHRVSTTIGAPAAVVSPAMLALESEPAFVNRGWSTLCGAMGLCSHPCESAQRERRAA